LVRFSIRSLLLLGIVSAAPALAQQQDRAIDRSKPLGLSFTTGADYSVGDYGAAANTKILLVPFSLRATTGRLRLSATLPWLRIDGPGYIVGGAEGGPIVIDPNSPAPRTVRSGIGDVTFGATYGLLQQDKAGIDLDIGARVKLPTASRSKGLSTGKTDVSVSADISRSFGNVTPFVTLGYRMPGDPTGFDLKNSASVSVGSSFVAGKSVVIVSYDYSGRTSAFSDPSHSLFGALAVPVTKRITLTGYGTAGLSNGAPDYGVGMLLTLKAL